MCRQASNADARACCHNLDRLGVLLVLLHVETRTGLALVLLFALGAYCSDCMRNSSIFGATCSVATWRFGLAVRPAGTRPHFFAQDDQNAPVETSIFVVYSVLYLVHMCALCSRRDRRLRACVV